MLGHLCMYISGWICWRWWCEPGCYKYSKWQCSSIICFHTTASILINANWQVCNNIVMYIHTEYFHSWLCTDLLCRAIYLRHALKTKYAFQMVLLVLWHFWLLFVLPGVTKTYVAPVYLQRAYWFSFALYKYIMSKALSWFSLRHIAYTLTCITRHYLPAKFCLLVLVFYYRPFTKNVAAQFIYFFKSLYFIISSFQIISGYPTKVLGYFLGKKYTTVYGLLFSGYRAIPLLPELREVMDWVFTDTALSLFHWLRVQEIYAKLYLVKVRRQREKVCHSHNTW